jgi:hypothetical protein
MSAGRPSGLLGALDPASRARLRLFAFKLLIVAVFSLAYTQSGVPFCRAMSLLCLWYSFFAGAAALFRRERIGATSLNGWDEMLAFDGLALLAEFLEGLAR